MNSLGERQLFRLQRDTFGYFLHEPDVATGLVPDNTAPGEPASVAVVGLALTAYPVGVERGYLGRDEAAARTLVTLRFFANAPRGRHPDVTGNRGFFYHFLDMKTGRRAWESELSTMDTALFLAGVLTAASYFDGTSEVERKIRELSDALYREADWAWALDGGETLTHGWTPEGGFLAHRWTGYSEALLLYVLALGSPTYPISPKSYRAFTSTYEWKKIYGLPHVFAGPLFIHQLPQIWLDLRGVSDDAMRHFGIDYFENSRRATHVQQRYAIRNPRRWVGYDAGCWGITASDGPGPAVRKVRGRRRRFYDYLARGVPYGPDDGTLAPWGAIASLPFAPEIVLPTIRVLHERHSLVRSRYGFLASFNPSFRVRGHGWVAKKYLGLNEGPIVLMIENARSGLVWNLARRSPYVVRGLRRAGFRGGWLD